MPKTVRIYRWRAPRSMHNNFGDEITFLLLRRLFGIAAEPSPMEQADLLGAGSILDAWTLRRRRNPLAEALRWVRRSSVLRVWGSGFILPDTDADWPQKLQFSAVRGSLTAQRTEPSATLGDPGILASLLLKHRPKKKTVVGVVPNHIDTEYLSRLALPDHWRVIDPSAPVDAVLEAIGSCELIVSSSLHGLITADSFGIPTVWARTEHPLYGGTDFKFFDYASGRGSALNKQVSYDEAIRMALEDMAALSTLPGRDVEQWQRELIDAFPDDL